MPSWHAPRQFSRTDGCCTPSPLRSTTRLGAGSFLLWVPTRTGAARRAARIDLAVHRGVIAGVAGAAHARAPLDPELEALAADAHRDGPIPALAFPAAVDEEMSSREGGCELIVILPGRQIR